jgi:hypothetical protein
MRLCSAVQSQSTFLVGCGALGCEFLKNFALMGLGTAPGAVVHCTDNDRIAVCSSSGTVALTWVTHPLRWPAVAADLEPEPPVLVPLGQR